MTSVPSDTSGSFWRKIVRKSAKVDPVVNTASVIVDLREEQGFAVPGRLFEQLPFAVYVGDRDGLVLRYNHRAADQGLACEITLPLA